MMPGSTGYPDPVRYRPGCAGSRHRNRRGILLPAALVLILAATLVGAALLILARSAVVLGAGDRMLAEALAVRSPSVEALEPGVGADLPGGYRLVDTPIPGAPWRVWSLAWEADPMALAAGLRGVVEARSVEVSSGEGPSGDASTPEPIRLLGPADGCPEDQGPFPLVWLRGEGAAVPVTLGPLGLGEWMDRADVVVMAGSAPPSPGHPRLVSVEVDRVDTGVLRGLVVVAGDLELGGDVVVVGLLLVGGDLRLSGNARIAGALRVGGGITVETPGRIDGCRDLVAREVAGIAAIEVPFPVSGGHFLGRF